jgi:hypothetical protein
MQFSENTLNVFKNFAAINNGVILKKGSRQRTWSPDESILAEATIEEDINEDFGIYDFPQFLGNLTTLDKPEVTITNEKAVLNDGQVKLDYYACALNLIMAPPDKELEISDPDAQFFLSDENLQKILKVGSLNALPNILFSGDGKTLSAKVFEQSNDTSNSAVVELGETSETFEMLFKSEYFNIIPQDYNVSLKVGAFAELKNEAGNVRYFIAGIKVRK